MKTRFGLALVATVSSLALVGCNAGASSSGSSEARTDMVIAHTAEPANLDFTTSAGAAVPQALMENVYESLVRIDQEGQIQPALAESWDLSEDRKTYTFKLRKDVKFSSGADFTADDVKFSYERVKSDAWKNALKAKMDVVDNINVVDDATVEITLSHPSNRWLFDLASLVGAVFDEEGVNDLANKAVGTGPFTVDTFTRGQKIVFAARDDYWGEEPKLDKVTFKYFKDPVASANALKSGEVDVLASLQAPDLLSSFEKEADKYKVVEGTTNGEVLLALNNASGVFKDKKVREAVMYALDEQAIIDTAWSGHGTLIGSMVPPTDPYYEDLTNKWPHDVEKAKKLIEEAGVKDQTVMFTVPNLPYATASANVVVSQLEAVGLKAKVETQEFPAVWLDKTFTNHEYDMSIINHIEARDILTVFGEGYYTGYDSKKISDIAAKADEGSEEEYTEGMKQVARTITEDAAAGFLFLFPNLVVTNSKVTGVAENQVSDAFRIADLGWE